MYIDEEEEGFTDRNAFRTLALSYIAFGFPTL